MNKIYTFFAFLVTYSFSFPLYAQQQIEIKQVEIPIKGNDAKNPCISTEEYARIKQQSKENTKRLGLNTTLKKSKVTTKFIWPLKSTVSNSENLYYAIVAYVDEDTATESILDYNCGKITYDGHKGIDIQPVPYPLLMMDNKEIEVIAAAAGTIITKTDGYFDRNCANDPLLISDSNSIFILHSDGSQSLYGHMKKNSLTPKTVGSTVVAGEYLGLIGSSGNSAGPHLHFEIDSSNTSESYIDPYSGTCNSFTTTSFWINQKPYLEPAIVRLSVNTADIVLKKCPENETINESNTFSIPFQGVGLAKGSAFFNAFLRDIPISSIINFNILNPNGSVYYSTSYKYLDIPPRLSRLNFPLTLPTDPGTYSFQVTYNNVTTTKSFEITTVLGIPTLVENEKIQVFPNPTNDVFSITGKELENGNYKFTLTDSLGQIIKTENSKIDKNAMQKDFSIADLARGIYFLTIDSDNSRTIKKLIKQ